MSTNCINVLEALTLFSQDKIINVKLFYVARIQVSQTYKQVILINFAPQIL